VDRPTKGAGIAEPETPRTRLTFGARPILQIVLVLLLVEGAIVETVLALILGHSAWVWIALALHLYAMLWIAGLIASLHVLPHLVGKPSLQLRDSGGGWHGRSAVRGGTRGGRGGTRSFAVTTLRQHTIVR
jgi:hypothetical protein